MTPEQTCSHCFECFCNFLMLTLKVKLAKLSVPQPWDGQYHRAMPTGQVGRHRVLIP